MKTIDLTPHYLSFIKGEEAEQGYIGQNPNFFNHYFTYWASRGTFESPYSEQELKGRSNMIKRHIDIAEGKLNANSLSTASISALIVEGCGTANGHAFKDGNDFTAWFAAESFPSEEIAKVFTMHEIIHAIHYSYVPDLYFETEEERRCVWRQLAVEGIATYLTQQFLEITEEEALWGGYLTDSVLNSWMESCRNQERELAAFTLERYDSSDISIKLFEAADESNIFFYRGGYYLGRLLVERIVSRYAFSVIDLLTMPAVPIKSLLFEAVAELMHTGAA